MNFQNMTVSTKLTLAFGALVGLVLLVSVLALHALGDANDRFASYVSGISARAEAAEQVRPAVDRGARRPRAAHDRVAQQRVHLLRVRALGVEHEAVQRRDDDVFRGFLVAHQWALHSGARQGAIHLYTMVHAMAIKADVAFTPIKMQERSE